MHESEKCKWSRSVVSESLRPHGIFQARVLEWVPIVFCGPGHYCSSKVFFFFLKNLHTVLSSQLPIYSPKDCRRIPFSPQQLKLYCWRIFEMAILTDVRWYLIGHLICNFVISSDVEYLSMCFMAICMFSTWKCPFWTVAHFFLCVVGFCYRLILSSVCLYVLEIDSLWVSLFSNIVISHSESCLFPSGFPSCSNAFQVNSISVYVRFTLRYSKMRIQKHSL